MSIVLFFRNFHNKTSGVLFIFVCASMGHAHFFLIVTCISWAPMKPSKVLFGCKLPIGKLASEVYKWLLCPVFRPGKETQLQAKDYQCVSHL